MNQIKPLFRWAGGKTKYIKHITPLLKNEYSTYVEPFFGGGAVFCHVVNNSFADSYIINDVNAELILLYQTIKNNPDSIITGASELEAKYFETNDRKKYYYQVREAYWENNKSDYLYFLLKTCFNGVWQTCVASNGMFATPCGLLKEKTTFVDSQQIIDWSKVLQYTDITCSDFSNLNVPSNSLVYCDPPYRDSFTTYGTGFNDEDQIRTVNWCQQISSQKDVHVILSNKSDGVFFEKFNPTAFQYFDATHTAGRRKKHDDGSFTAKKAREVLMVWGYTPNTLGD